MGGRGSRFGQTTATAGGGGGGGTGGGGETTKAPRADKRDELTKKYFNGKVDVKMSKSAKAFMNKHFGKNINEAKMAKMVGAYDGMKLSVRMVGKDTVRVVGKHEWLSKDGFIRSFRVDDRGRAHVVNEMFFLKDIGKNRKAPKGLGARVFANQVKGLEGTKAAYIKTYGLRADNEKRPAVGYNAWALLGYNAAVSKRVQDLWRVSSRDRWFAPPPTTLHELFRFKDGRSFWKMYGESSTMVFNLSKGSDSRKILGYYKRGKKIKV